MSLPEITIAHFLYVLFWALLGVAISIVAWSQGDTPSYKDFLASTLSASLEAVGVELTRGQLAAIMPLVVGLFLGAAVRFLPEELKNLKFSLKIFNLVLTLQGTQLARVLFTLFFLFQLFVLLFAYREWLDPWFANPGAK